jgi:hypothetical protein
MSQRTFRRAGCTLLLALAIWGVLPVGPGAAQDLVVRFQGRVSWISGDTLVLSTADTPSVRVDLSQVDQGEYQTLANGDSVVVTGIIPGDKDRVIATSVVPLTP